MFGDGGLDFMFGGPGHAIDRLIGGSGAGGFIGGGQTTSCSATREPGWEPTTRERTSSKVASGTTSSRSGPDDDVLSAT